jgi:hypothetical protein
VIDQDAWLEYARAGGDELDGERQTVRAETDLVGEVVGHESPKLGGRAERPVGGASVSFDATGERREAVGSVRGRFAPGAIRP